MFQQRREIEYTKIYERIRNAKERIILNIGGARSSKSHSIGQRLVEHFWNTPKRKILVTRKTGPALYLTAQTLIIDLLKEYGMYGYVQHNKFHKEIINPRNGAKFAFCSIDNPTKIKSTDWNDIWMEEGDEFDWADWLVLQTRMSAPTTKEFPNQIHISFNPADEQGWINQRLILNPKFSKKLKIIWSSYKDNPFLSKEYKQELEDLKDQDEAAWQIYAKGTWGLLKNFIYKPYTVLQEFPETYDDVIYGLDFGFNNPSALIRIGIKDVKNCYLEQKIYERGLTNSMLIDKMREVVSENERMFPFYADAAEPARIAEICAAGFNVYSANKTVKHGLDYCKSKTFYTTANNVDLNKERGTYRWSTVRRAVR